MLKAIIENKGNTLLVEFPCKRQPLAEHLASIGVTKPAYDIKCIPIAPHIYFTQFLDDAVPEERSFGLMAGLLLLSQCDELWYFGDSVSSGMVREIVAAKEQNIPVRYISASEIERIKNENGGTQNEVEQEIH